MTETKRAYTVLVDKLHGKLPFEKTREIGRTAFK
jgi:hypothetical protein